MSKKECEMYEHFRDNLLYCEVIVRVVVIIMYIIL